MTKQEFKILANGYMDSFIDLCNMDKDLSKYGIDFNCYNDKENKSVEEILDGNNRFVCSYLLEIAFEEKEERDKLLEELVDDLKLEEERPYQAYLNGAKAMGDKIKDKIKNYPNWCRDYVLMENVLDDIDEVYNDIENDME